MKKYLIIAVITFFAVISAITIFSNSARYELTRKLNIISAGSYTYAEIYELNYSQVAVINAVEKFKQTFPKYEVPNVTIDNHGSFSLNDSMSENHWFVAYLYDPVKNRIFNIAIRGNENNTSLGFNSINEGLDVGNWQTINNDFSYDENESLKKEFEQTFLNPIKKNLNNN